MVASLNCEIGRWTHFLPYRCASFRQPAPGGAGETRAMCGHPLYEHAAASSRSSSVSVKSAGHARYRGCDGGNRNSAPPYVESNSGPTSSLEKSVAKKASVDSSSCSAYHVVRHG
jgi:hypothetical protein